MRIKGEIDELTLRSPYREIGFYGYVLNNLPLLMLQQDERAYLCISLVDTVRWRRGSSHAGVSGGLCGDAAWLASNGTLEYLPFWDGKWRSPIFITHPLWASVEDILPKVEGMSTASPNDESILTVSKWDVISTEILFSAAREQGCSVTYVNRAGMILPSGSRDNFPQHPIPVVAPPFFTESQ